MIVQINIPDWEPTPHQIWDAHECPPKPTAKDLEEKILEAIDELGFYGWLEEWCLLEDASIWVNGFKIYDRNSAFPLAESREPDWDE